MCGLKKILFVFIFTIFWNNYCFGCEMPHSEKPNLKRNARMSGLNRFTKRSERDSSDSGEVKSSQNHNKITSSTPEAEQKFKIVYPGKIDVEEQDARKANGKKTVSFLIPDGPEKESTPLHSSSKGAKTTIP
ncbi:uncharacterized protein LOC116340626 [Contarinia nasturtii]|uniref:uncharacterized protein LOC116340626 n=1 Tax=Contarinia nasturtii TaxID=265458 RepID=UPI0012D40CAF|nr:uncharacterized protein LOC116340626 [Contarinia nasturtii]